MFVPIEETLAVSGRDTIQYDSRARTHNRILILAEDSFLARSLSRTLTSLGLHVVFASKSVFVNGTSDSLPYDGIIIDLDIVESPRLQFFYEFHSSNPHIPIVVIGQEKRIYDVFFALIGGATEFLVKPINAILLKRICLRLFL